MSTSLLTYQQSVFKRYHTGTHFSEFLPTRWRQKSTGVDMEQNYVTVTLCIINRAAMGTEFLSPYPPHIHGDPHGSPYPRQSTGLPWGRNFYPHTHPIPMGIPMGIPIPTTYLIINRQLGDGWAGYRQASLCIWSN